MAWSKGTFVFSLFAALFSLHHNNAFAQWDCPARTGYTATVLPTPVATDPDEEVSFNPRGMNNSGTIFGDIERYNNRTGDYVSSQFVYSTANGFSEMPNSKQFFEAAIWNLGTNGTGYGSFRTTDPEGDAVLTWSRASGYRNLSSSVAKLKSIQDLYFVDASASGRVLASTPEGFLAISGSLISIPLNSSSNGSIEFIDQLQINDSGNLGGKGIRASDGINVLTLTNGQTVTSAPLSSAYQVQWLTDMNNRNAILGGASRSNGSYLGFVWLTGSSPRMIAPLSGFVSLFPSAMNNNNEVGGIVVNETDSAPVIWTRCAGVRRLSTLVPAAISSDITRIAAINDSGQILVTGNQHSYLLTPQ